MQGIRHNFNPAALMGVVVVSAPTIVTLKIVVFALLHSADYRLDFIQHECHFPWGKLLIVRLALCADIADPVALATGID